MNPIDWGAEFRVLARRYADRTAIVEPARLIDYREVFDKAAGLTRALEEAGCRTGDAVVTMFRNGTDAAAAMFATMMAGAVEVPLNPVLGLEDRQHCGRVAKARFLLTSAEFATGHGLPVDRVVVAEDVGPVPLAQLATRPVEADAPSRIVFTSGTTGRPKGAVHSHAGRWTGNLLLRASLPFRPGAGDRVLLMTPFSHGTSLMTWAYLSLGASVMLVDGVDLPVVLGALEEGHCNEVFAPPTVLDKITRAVEGRAVSPLRTIFTGTAVLKPTLYRRARAAFGPIVRVTYGKSEVFNPITVLEAAETEAWYESGGDDACVGWPAPGVEIAIRGEDGAAMPEGEVGEVLIRARHLMTGYMTADGFAPIGPDGYHDTGDLGYVDAAGRVHLVGRMADVIKSGGYKVSPEEVERALAPALQPAEVAVVGIPSDYWGEVILAAIERPPDDWEARLEPVLREMTAYKRPRLLVPLEELPRNGIGKIVRSAIRDHVLSRYRLSEGPRPVLERRPT